MFKSRAAIPFYNGSIHIKEQVDSIINSGIDEVYIYNDGSSKEEKNSLIRIFHNDEYKRNVKVITKKNEGLIITFIRMFNEAKNDGVNILFLSDQDDKWFDDKFRNHINLHDKYHFVLSPSLKWNGQNTDQKLDFSNSAHKMSLNISDLPYIDIDKYIKYIGSKNSEDLQFINNHFHDTFLIMMLASMGIFAKWHKKSAGTLHRTHSESITNNPDNIDIKMLRDWSNKRKQYEIYREMNRKLFNKKLTKWSFFKTFDRHRGITRLSSAITKTILSHLGMWKLLNLPNDIWFRKQVKSNN